MAGSNIARMNRMAFSVCGVQFPAVPRELRLMVRRLEERQSIEMQAKIAAVARDATKRFLGKRGISAREFASWIRTRLSQVLTRDELQSVGDIDMLVEQALEDVSDETEDELRDAVLPASGGSSAGFTAQGMHLRQLSDLRNKVIETMSNVMKSIPDLKKAVADNTRG